ncbi:hypothetical protein Tco_0301007 [Tanacetum coccineum]
MSTSTHPIIVLSDSYIEDAFSSTTIPDYIPASPDYSPASSGKTSSDPSEDLSKDLLSSLAILPFHDYPYMKVMQAYNATSNELHILLPQATIAPPIVLPPSPVVMSTHPIIILSNSDVEDAFSSKNTPDYTSASPDYSPASPGNTSSDPSEELSKDLLASLAISPFHDNPYMKVKQAYNATNNESPIPPPRAPIAPPTILPLFPVLPPSLLFDSRDFFLPEEILPPQK